MLVTSQGKRFVARVPEEETPHSSTREGVVGLARQANTSRDAQEEGRTVTSLDANKPEQK